MLAIFKRELRAYFITPIGYVFTAVFLLSSGILFGGLILQNSATFDMSYYFLGLMLAFIVVIPLLTMRLLSEERKTKTEQMILTAPISLIGMVMAKDLAAFVLFLATMLLSCFNFIPLFMYSVPNPAILYGNMLAILLAGAAFIAIGLFISAMTENQLASAIITIVVIAFLILSGAFAGYVNSDIIRFVIIFTSIFYRYQPFTYGMFDVTSLLYYISLVIIFLFLTVRVYEMRRWQ